MTSIKLTDQEATLRQLLLDVSNYIGTLEGCAKPELRVTGGWVRDKLLGSTSHDIDISIDTMTGYRFGTLMRQFLEQPDSKANYDPSVLGSLAKIEKNPEKSKQLETTTTKVFGLDIDLVNLRKETYSEDSRNPTMEFGTPEEDALRRDATVNALFYNLSTSQIEDLTGRGLRDMERKVIKTPLPALQTFKDDPLRVLRSIRFASRLGYQICAADEDAMSNDSIKAALRLKISRERVGVEIVKMLKGPNPRMALSLIDRLRLYNTVFTDPTDECCKQIETKHWNRAYNMLLRIEQSTSAAPIEQTSLLTLRNTLLRNADDSFLAWTLTCFVPWAREPAKPPKKTSTKRPPFQASIAAREGIKAETKLFKIIDDAVSHLEEIITMKNNISTDNQSTTSSLKRKQSTISRGAQGQAIRSWGSHWRSSVLYAFLVQISEVDDLDASERLLNGYATWISELKSLDLLNVDTLKPLVNGKHLSQALGPSGPWMKKALDIAMEWQLRNPEQTDAAGGIAEVVARKRELGLD